MNPNKTTTSRRSQRRFSAYQQETPKATNQQQQKKKQKKLQQQQLVQELEQDQEVQYIDAEQNVQQEQEQIKQEIYQEQVLDVDHEQEQDQKEDPQLKTQLTLVAEKVSKHTQTNNEQDLWCWVPRYTADTQWECLVKGKGQEILEVVASKSRSRHENASSQQSTTIQMSETVQHRTPDRTTLPQNVKYCKFHAAQLRAVQHGCQVFAASTGCSNNASETKNFPQMGNPQGKMPAQQMFPPGMQPVHSTSLHHGTHSHAGLSSSVQNSMASQEQQQPPNANSMAPLSHDAVAYRRLAMLQDAILGVLMLERHRPAEIPIHLKERFRRMLEKVFPECGNRLQQ